MEVAYGKKPLPQMFPLLSRPAFSASPPPHERRIQRGKIIINDAGEKKAQWAGGRARNRSRQRRRRSNEIKSIWLGGAPFALRRCFIFSLPFLPPLRLDLSVGKGARSDDIKAERRRRKGKGALLLCCGWSRWKRGKMLREFSSLLLTAAGETPANTRTKMGCCSTGTE